MEPFSAPPNRFPDRIKQDDQDDTDSGFRVICCDQLFLPERQTARCRLKTHQQLSRSTLTFGRNIQYLRQYNMNIVHCRATTEIGLVSSRSAVRANFDEIQEIKPIKAEKQIRVVTGPGRRNPVDGSVRACGLLFEQY